MNPEIRPYSEHHSAGSAWFGAVPSHWELLPNRALFIQRNVRNQPTEQLLSVTIDKGVIRQAELLADSSKRDSSNENKENYKLVEPGDIAYNKMRAWQGSIGVSAYRGIVSPAYIIFRLRETRSAYFFHYLFRIPAFAKEAERWSYGISSDQWSLRWEDFKQIYCPVPPSHEQVAIVAFLAHTDRQINKLVLAFRRLVGVSKSVAERKASLVAEYRTRLITDVVTGKLDVRDAALHLPRESPKLETALEEIEADKTTDVELVSTEEPG